MAIKKARYKAEVLFIKLIYKIFICVIVDLACFHPVYVLFECWIHIRISLALHCFSNIFTG